MPEDENTILVRHLPGELSDDEKTDLLQHFGAERVSVMGTKGPMKHCAFATFRDHEYAKKAIFRLHQQDILGSKLIVEFAKRKEQSHFPNTFNEKRKTSPEKEAIIDAEKAKIPPRLEEPDIAESATQKLWGIKYPPNPQLHYCYPAPTVSTLTNIANALAACPKFYTQVLHLMNKMNLPAPFGAVTPTPPLATEVAHPPPKSIQEPDSLEIEEMDLSSTEESEIGSDGDDRPKTEHTAMKHRRKTKSDRPRKKAKLTQQIPVPRDVLSAPAVKTSEIFDQPQQPLQKRIQLNMPSSVVPLEIVDNRLQPNTEADVYHDHPDATPSDPLIGGFGTIEPVEKAAVADNIEDAEVDIDHSKFIPVEHLKKGRVSESEMRHLSAFKNYQAGDPTTRLYVKNLARQTTEEDLRNIYGRYVDWQSELEQNMFDIRLMKEGRMKGQAFITVTNEKSAKQALRDSNGYVLHGKPMVVQFARSAKAKEEAKTETKGKQRQ